MPWSTSNGRTSTPEWRVLRRQVLRRDPVCTVCHRASSREVDHIIPHAEGGPLTLDNLRGVCPPCHRRITQEYAARRRHPVSRRRTEEKHPGRLD